MVQKNLLVFVFQNICSEFEQRWVSKNLHTENLISIGSNTLHNLLRIPWEPGLMRPEMFGKYFSYFFFFKNIYIFREILFGCLI